MHPGTTWWTATKVVLRSAFLRIWSAVLVHAEGGQRWFQPLMKAQILIISSRTEAKVPRRMAWRSMMPNQISTRLSHDPRGPGQVDVDPGVRCQPGLAFRVLVGGVVVHDQMQLLVG